MRVTICELPDERSAFDGAWNRLVSHVLASRSQVVLLPEIAPDQWSVHSHRADDEALEAPGRAHDAWHQHLEHLGSALVLGSRTVEFGNESYDEGFVWDAEHGVRSVHAKLHAADKSADFIPMEVHGLRICFLLGRELLLEEEARRYGQAGVDLLAIRRPASKVSFADWFAQAQKDAELAGAHVLASHRSGKTDGHAFVIAPDGKVLGRTDRAKTFLSVELSL